MRVSLSVAARRGRRPRTRRRARRAACGRRPVGPAQALLGARESSGPGRFCPELIGDEASGVRPVWSAAIAPSGWPRRSSVSVDSARSMAASSIAEQSAAQRFARQLFVQCHCCVRFIAYTLWMLDMTRLRVHRGDRRQGLDHQGREAAELLPAGVSHHLAGYSRPRRARSSSNGSGEASGSPKRGSSWPSCDRDHRPDRRCRR